MVVEILLGDKALSDQTGLGELLANRCAYSIASTHSQRHEILQDFRKIYEVRSKIVHRGKSRLALGERMLFDKLRWMCRRIIQEEAYLILRARTHNPSVNRTRNGKPLQAGYAERSADNTHHRLLGAAW